MSLLTYQRRNKSFGFTLVELLVSMAILLLILLVCAELTLTAQGLLSSGMERIDSDSQARLFFDRFMVDIESMVKRADIDYIVKDVNATPTSIPQTGNDSMAFFAKAPGYFSTSPDPAPRKTVSLLAYRVNGQTYQLERLALGIGWNSNSKAAPLVFLARPPLAPGMQIYNTWGSAVAGLNGNSPDLNLGDSAPATTVYQVLADGVFRFEYCYILRDGTYSNSPYISADKALNGWQDVVALYVAIAVLDDRSRVVVANGAANPNLAAVTAQLKDFPLDGTQTYPPLSQWEAVINQPNFAALANLPVKIAPYVRIFARTIPINNLPPDSSL